MKYVKYNLRTNLVEHGEGNNYVRFRITCMGKRVDLYTGIVVSPVDWDFKTGYLKPGSFVGRTPFDIINTDLMQKRSFVEGYFNECALNDILPQLSELKDRFNQRFRYSSEAKS